jgi:Nrap protein nucleotidyltransferase domain 4/Nrap protein domain 3
MVYTLHTAQPTLSLSVLAPSLANRTGCDYTLDCLPSCVCEACTLTSYFQLYATTCICYYMHIHRLHYAAVLIDPATGFNVLSRVSESALQELQQDAVDSLALLQHEGTRCSMSTGRGSYSFSALFLTRATFWRKYDAFVRVPIKAHTTATATTATVAVTDAMQQIESDAVAAMLCDKPLQAVVGDQAVVVLSKGLNDRVKLVRPLYGAAGEHSNDFIGIPGTTANSITSTVAYSSINSRSSSGGKKSSTAPKFVRAQTTDAIVCIGLQLDTSTAMRSVDRGPTADDHDAAAAFRQFWGALSELRRFKDGAIVEAVVWSGTKHSIIEQIVRHCLARHLPLRCATSGATTDKQQQQQQYRVQYIGGNSMISAVAAQSTAAATATADGNSNGGTDKSSKSSTALLQQQCLTLPTDDDALTRLAITAFDILAITLKDLQGLPLRVDVVTPASTYLRYTAVVPPVTHPMASSSESSSSVALWNMSSARALGRITNQIDPIHVVIRFESSSRWPTDSVSAIQHSSVAFLIRLSQCLEQQHQILSAVVTHDNCDAAMLDVLLDGYCFRLTICNDHEITALQDKAAQGVSVFAKSTHI